MLCGSGLTIVPERMVEPRGCLFVATLEATSFLKAINFSHPAKIRSGHDQAMCF
jgi:hypothetical protein